MKKVILLLMIAAVMFSCKKNETTTVQPEQKYAEVSFNVNQIFPEADRDDYPFGLPECSDTDPVYAHIVIMIDPDDATTEVFNGDIDLFTLPNDPNLYTQAIKLMLDGCDHVAGGDACCNDFYVTQFMVYDAQDDLIYAAPLSGSNAQGWLDYPDRQLDLLIHICEFTKYQYDIDVLCYEEAWYLEFGFVWFNVHEVVLREICFFGDVCLKFPGDYYGSSYANQLSFPAIDVPAIAEIKVFKWVGDGIDDPDGYWEEHGGSPYTNNNAASFWGVGAPLCVPYIDYLDKDDIYKAELYVMLKQGDGFPFIYMDEWIWFNVFEDNEGPHFDIGDDNIADYVIGNCIVNGADYVYEPWMNLPETATMNLRNPAAPGAITGYYWDVKLYDFYPSGSYDIPETSPPPSGGGNDTDWLGGWCGDKYTTIGYGGHDVVVRSTVEDASTYPAGAKVTNDKRHQLNYLFNNWTASGYNPLSPGSAANVTTMQQSIWGTIHWDEGAPHGPYFPGGGDAALMAQAAIDAVPPGGTYNIIPGGWAGVLFFEGNGEVYSSQLILIVVDP